MTFNRGRLRTVPQHEAPDPDPRLPARDPRGHAQRLRASQPGRCRRHHQVGYQCKDLLYFICSGQVGTAFGSLSVNDKIITKTGEKKIVRYLS